MAQSYGYCIYVHDPKNPEEVVPLQDVLDECCSGDDIFLQDSVFDPVANTLTMTLSDGTVIGPLNMSTLVPVATDGVTILGDGTAGDPLVGCCTVDNGDGTYTVTQADGTTFNIDTNDDGSETIVSAGAGVVVTGTGTAADPYVVVNTSTGNTSSLVDNGDGTFTHDDGTGNTTTFRICCPDNYTDNEAGSADAAGGANTVDLTMADGSTQTFCEGVTQTASTDSCFWGGMGGGGYNPAGYVVRRAEIDGKTLYVDGAPEHTAVCGHGFSDATVYDPPPATDQNDINPVSVTINNLQLCRPMHVQATASFGQTNFSVGTGNDMGYTITYRLDYNGSNAPGFIDGWYNTPFSFTNTTGQVNFDIAPPSYHFCAVLAPGAAATLESDADVTADTPGGLVMAVQRTTLTLFGVTI